MNYLPYKVTHGFLMAKEDTSICTTCEAQINIKCVSQNFDAAPNTK